jgi:hypothetical protein
MAYPSVTYSFTNGTTISATEVNQNFTDLINGASDGTKDYNINALSVAGSANLNGNVALGNATSDDVTVTGRIASDIVPKTDDTYDLGTSALAWKDGYFDGAVKTDTISELTSAAGVTIDGLLIKDSGLLRTGTVISDAGGTAALSVATGGEVTLGPSGFTGKHTNNGYTLELISGTLSDGGISRVLAGVPTTGTTSNSGAIGSYKHSGISKQWPFLQLSIPDVNLYYYWTDASANFRISSTVTHIGTTSGTVVGTQTSDERTKENIIPCSKGLSTVLALEPVEFDRAGVHHVGFVAQRTVDVLPEAVYDTNEAVFGEDQPTKLAMDYSEIIAPMVKAIQELSAKVDSLQSELNTLKGQ